MSKRPKVHTGSHQPAESIALSNLEMLQIRFLGDARQRVSELVRMDPSAKLDILRSHLVRSIEAAEIPYRDAADRLIEFAGWLELGLACNVLRLAHVFADELLWNALADPVLRRYYELFYPQLVASALRIRATGEAINYETLVDAHHVFIRALSLDEVITRKTVRGFLRVIDDFVLEDQTGHTFDKGDFITTINNPDLFAAALFPTQDPDAGQSSTTSQEVKVSATPLASRTCSGFIEFLQFLRSLHNLVRDLDAQPLLQSAIWHQYGYWLHLLSAQLGGVIATGLDELASYVDTTDPSESDEEALKVATFADIAETTHVLQVLTSSQYRAQLEAEFFRITGDNEMKRLFSELRHIRPVRSIDISAGADKSLQQYLSSSS